MFKSKFKVLTGLVNRVMGNFEHLLKRNLNPKVGEL